MTRQRAFILIFLITLLIVACEPSEEGSQDAMVDTQSSMPSLTQTKPDESQLTKEPSPTQTIKSTSTKQPEPTNTLEPTTTPMEEVIIELSENEVDNAVMVYVPAGEFLMGSESSSAYLDEAPEHTVYVDAFWIYKHEVTNAQFAAFLDAEGNQSEGEVPWLNAGDVDLPITESGGQWIPDEGYEDHPVVEVSWFGADAYCQWAGGRLPTEAEWEKAARGTDGRTYPWGNSDVTGEHANFCDINCSWIEYRDNDQDDGYSETAPVGSFPDGASPYGALDMACNVMEWVSDWYDASYYSQSGNAENPQGPSSGYSRVARGGDFWSVDIIGYRQVQITKRWQYTPDKPQKGLGFRCILPTTP